MNFNPDQFANNAIAVIVALGKIVGPAIVLIWSAINQWQTNALKSQLAQQSQTTDKRLDDHSASIKTLLLNTPPPVAPVPATPSTVQVVTPASVPDAAAQTTTTAATVIETVTPAPTPQGQGEPLNPS